MSRDFKLLDFQSNTNSTKSACCAAQVGVKCLTKQFALHLWQNQSTGSFSLKLKII